MATMENKVEIGRPSRTRLDKLRDDVWITGVKLQSGLKTGYALEKAIEPHRIKREKGHINRPRKWDNYVNGTQGPGKIKDKPSSVELAQAMFPGTARWHEHPIWRVLEEGPMDRYECEVQIRRLEHHVTEVLYEELPNLAGQKVLRAFEPHVADWLMRLGNLDGLAAILLLVRYAEAISSSELRKDALACYPSFQKTIPLIPMLEPHSCELFELVDVRFKHWAFISNSLRMDITIFRENRAEDLRKNGVEIKSSWMDQFIEITQQPYDDNSKGMG